LDTRLQEEINTLSISRNVFTVDTHTEGEPTRIVIGGIRKIPGRSLVDKRDYLSSNMDHLRRALMHEPRGHGGMYGAILVEPTVEEADAAVIFMRNDSFNDDMCIHGSIGVTTALIEMGFLDPSETLRLETPGGLVESKLEMSGSKVKSVTIRNIPSFYYGKFPVRLNNGTNIDVEIAFGGNFYAIVQAEDIGLKVKSSLLGPLSRTGAELIKLVNESIKIEHPTLPITGAHHALISDRRENHGPQAKNVVIGDSGWFDRSPCGTGTCAKMVALNKNGHLDLNEEFVHESIIGTTFRGKLVERTRVGGLEAFIPEITGSAFITGIHQFMIDPDDPLAEGFSLA